MPTTFDSTFDKEPGKSYTISRFTYPEHLVAGEEFNGNKVLFFINVSSNGQYSGQQAGSAGPAEFAMYDLVQSDVNSKSGNAALKQFEKLTPGLNLTSATTKRLSAAIALYMPNSIMQGTSVGWGEEDYTTDDASKYLASFGKAAEGDAGGAARAFGTGLAAQMLRGSNRVQQAARITPGNSSAELLFKNVDFRTFEFSYMFAPKSSAEARNVMNIIRMFKHHMLPEFKDSAKFLYIFPSEFTVRYYKGSDENKFIERQLTSVLTSVRINYTPNDQFSAFEDGMPQQIQMTLSFKELGLPTKESAPYNAQGT
jgi:hypothetical protein